MDRVKIYENKAETKECSHAKREICRGNGME